MRAGAGVVQSSTRCGAALRGDRSSRVESRQARRRRGESAGARTVNPLQVAEKQHVVEVDREDERSGPVVDGLALDERLFICSRLHVLLIV